MPNLDEIEGDEDDDELEEPVGKDEEMTEKPKTPKPKAAKKAKPKAKAKPERGGAGSRLIPEKASSVEKKVLAVLGKADEPLTIEDIAKEAHLPYASGDPEEYGTRKKPKEGNTTGYRRVANAMRRLRPCGYVKLEAKVLGTDKEKGVKGRSRSLYSITAAGRKFAEAL